MTALPIDLYADGILSTANTSNPDITVKPCNLCSCARGYISYTEATFSDMWELFHSSCSSCSDAETQHPTLLCEFCRHLRLPHFDQCLPPAIRERVQLNIGNLAERSAECQFCSFILRIVDLEVGALSSTSASLDNQSILIKEASHIRTNTIHWSFEDDNRNCGYFTLQTAPFDRFVDWRQVRSWIPNSMTESCSKVSLPQHLIDNFKLIDIQRKCIINAPNPCQYITLSYVWGNDSSRYFRASLDNITFLETPGALDTIDLPRSVSDAIEACSKLGYNHLWVDCLCILSDDAESKHEQIGQMDKIYEGSELCIVAAAGPDASYGLPGISRGRGCRDGEGEIYGLKLRPLLHSASTLIDASKWAQRAWTYQEDIMSNCRLFFTDMGAFFHIRLPHRQHYITDQPACTGLQTSGPMGSAALEYPAMLFGYTRRELSFSEDILRAFSGILHRLFEQATIFGLPLSQFDRAILWHTDDYLSTARCSNVDCLFPSWSWTSAFGTIRTSTDNSGVALWAIATAKGKSHQNLTIMIPDPELCMEYEDCSACMFAWASGCVAAARPTNIDLQNFTQQDILSPNYRWNSYKDYWMEVFGEYLTNPPFSREETEIARTNGRLLVFTQEAKFRINLIDKVDTWTPGKRYVEIRGTDGRTAGLIQLSEHHIKRFLTSTYDSARFIALSAGTDPAHELHPIECISCGQTHEPDLSASLPGDSCGRQNAPSVLSDQDHSIEQLLKPPPSGFSTSIFFLDTEGKPQSAQIVPVWQVLRPVMMNVMLVASDDPSDDRVVRRVGIGQIYLRKWARAERRLRTLILE
ncbi:HET-domain-containing protein [Rhizodiscina lignyota]|uniref:HET-domain-containing protein n=1 Tax=Rhizodiscina lignyota TaxID=1504668 RepID=A0A9P4I2F3_9PEZI|nr:HET-domain-containing protein [Rhizodiscina lignyota]